MKECPKCSSKEILKGKNRIYKVSSNDIIYSSIGQAVAPVRYICLECGYTEEWVKPEDLVKLKK